MFASKLEDQGIRLPIDTFAYEAPVRS
jgi:hypothetical protein